MRILGIDTGLAIVGWSVIDKDPKSHSLQLVAAGAITTKKEQSTPLRLSILHEALIEVIEEHAPKSMAVEDLFYFRNKTTITMIGQARGVILLAGQQKGLPIFNYTPLQVKSAVTGYGKADKKQVQLMVKRIFKLVEVPKPDDVADAIAVGVCHAHSY